MTNQGLEEAIKAYKGVAGEMFTYNPVSPNKRYNRNEFLTAQEQLSDLGKWRGAIEKNPEDAGARRDLSGLLHGDPTYLAGKTSQFALNQAKMAHDSGTDSMARYVKHNIDDFLGIIDDEGWANMALTLPLYKTGKEKHDNIVSIINDFKKMQKTGEEKDERIKYVLENLEKDKRVPEWGRRSIAFFAGSDPGYLNDIFVRDYQAKQAAFSGLIMHKGKARAGMLKKLVKESLSEAEREMERETNKGDKADIWKNNLKSYYLALAQAAYAPEREKDDEGKEEEKDRVKRITDRRKKGMPF